jgi:ribosomal protein S12 methylthiotransferase
MCQIIHTDFKPENVVICLRDSEIQEIQKTTGATISIDEKDGNSKNTYIGRTQGDAPEVDGNVFVKGKGLKRGDFVKVKIIDTLEYDLVGEHIK